MSETQPTPPSPEAEAPDSPTRLRIQERNRQRQQRDRKPDKPKEADISPVTGDRPKLRDLDSLIEAEMEAAMSGLSDKDLLGGEPDTKKPRGAKTGPSLLRKGRIVGVHGEDVFVEVPGNRAQGVLPLMQFPEGPPAVGSEVEFQTERYDPANGLLILTREGAVLAAEWDTLQIGQIVEARCIEVNRGGLAVDVNGIRGFLPISQIELFRVENAEQYVNQKLKCMVAEADKAEKNLVVSRKALLELEREEAAKKLWEELDEGQVRKGVVRLVKPFGAFVDLGGVDGLVPISEMSWTRIKDPGEVVRPGDTVEVVVHRIDRDARKVTLSLRQLKASPWDTAHLNYPEGTVLTGPVTRIEPFGAFVELEPGVEGLIHISELAPTRVRSPHEVVKLGEPIQVKVLRVDRDERKIALSVKAVKEAEKLAEEAAADSAAPPPKPRVKNPNLKGGLGGGGPLIPPLRTA